MNNGILAPQPFSVTTDLVGIKPLLGNPQPVPSTFARTVDSILGNSDGFSSKDFVMVIDTTKGGSTTISLNLGLSINFGPLEIFWGDGTSGGLIPAGTTQIRRPGSFETRFEPFSGSISLFSVSHTYPRHGIYIVVIKGIMGYTLTNVPHAGLSTVAILSYGDLVTITAIVNHSACGASLLYVPPYIKPTDPAAGAPFRRNLADCFNGCSNLNTSNFTTWDVSNVTDMRRCFQNCNITVNGDWNWDTRLVINFGDTFVNTRLSNITFSGWACNGGGTMFRSSNIRDCSFINWSGDNTLNMFQTATLNNCTLSGWRLTSAANAVFNSTAGNNLYLPNWDLRGVTNLSQMFLNSNGTKSGLDNWNVSGVTNMSSMFSNGSDFMTADLSNWDVSKVTNFTNFMIRGIVPTPNSMIKINNWSIQSGAILTGMFGDPQANKFVSLSGWSFGGNSAVSMFQAYNFTPSNNTFNGDLTTWDTSGIHNMGAMFNGCGNFKGTGVNGDLRNWNTSNVTDMSNMFLNCNVLTTNVSGWDTSKVTNMSGMFRNTFSNIVGGVRIGFYGSGLEYWNTSNVTNMSRMFDSNLTMDVNLSGWNTGKVTNMSSMFAPAGYGVESNFTGKGLDNWNVTGVTTIAAMFQGVTNKTNLNVNLSGWNLCNCTNMTNFMFRCNIGSGNYDILLNSWEATSTGNPVKPWATGINVHFGTAKYTAASSGARQRLVNYGWTITDGGFQA